MFLIDKKQRHEDAGSASVTTPESPAPPRSVRRTGPLVPHGRCAGRWPPRTARRRCAVAVAPRRHSCPPPSTAGLCVGELAAVPGAGRAALSSVLAARLLLGPSRLPRMRCLQRRVMCGSVAGSAAVVAGMAGKDLAVR